MTYVVRHAVPADAPAACEVVRRSIVELCNDDHQNDAAALNMWLANKTPTEFERWIGSRENLALVVERDKEILGFALLRIPATIELLYVSPEARFSGVSKALLGALEKAVSAAGVHEVRLDSSATALRFYERQGYSPTGPPVTVFGPIKGYPMSRQIARASSDASSRAKQERV